MVKYSLGTVNLNEQEMNLIFHSLADPTRRGILERVATDELTVSEIARPYKISLPAVSKHLKILEEARLVKRKRLGRVHSFGLEVNTMKKARNYLSFYARFWKDQLDGLEEYLLKSGGRNERI